MITKLALVVVVVSVGLFTKLLVSVLDRLGLEAVRDKHGAAATTGGGGFGFESATCD